MKEIWKAIEGYEGLYEVSNFGQIKSLARVIIRSDGISYIKKERILKPGEDGHGYYQVVLCNGISQKSKKIHTLVWDAFGKERRNGTKIQVDHVDNCKLNNIIDNLQLLNNRQNCSKRSETKKTSSKYTGVTWYKRDKKWHARIRINGKQKHLGYFNNEYKAHLAYQKALNNITN